MDKSRTVPSWGYELLKWGINMDNPRLFRVGGMNSFYFVPININFKFRSTSGSPCNQEFFFSRFPGSMNQTLDKRPSLGFASSQHVSLSKRRGRLGNLRESVFPLRVFHFALYPKPGVENLGVFHFALYSNGKFGVEIFG